MNTGVGAVAASAPTAQRARRVRLQACFHARPDRHAAQRAGHAPAIVSKPNWSAAAETGGGAGGGAGASAFGGVKEPRSAHNCRGGLSRRAHCGRAAAAEEGCRVRLLPQAGECERAESAGQDSQMPDSPREPHRPPAARGMQRASQLLVARTLRPCAQRSGGHAPNWKPSLGGAGGAIAPSSKKSDICCWRGDERRGGRWSGALRAKQRDEKSRLRRVRLRARASECSRRRR